MRRPAPHRRWIATVLAVALTSGSAIGAPADMSVSPPALVADPGVTYPASALRERFYERVEVRLILELDAAGNVAAATLERPGFSEFDAAALEAAKRLRFEPARRGSDAVAAKIRYRYSFEPPPPVLVGRVLDVRTGAPVARARLVVQTSDGSERTLDVAEDGSFSNAELARGPARLLAESNDHERAVAEVTLVPGDQTSVELRLESRTSAPATKAEAPVEVTVRGERTPPAVATYSRAEVRQIPGAFGDPFRAVETLPGVTPIASGLPFFYVRGAPPGNVGYYLDGVRVPYLYHVGIGPSVVQPALVEHVDVHLGGYPARYGRFAGGIVAAEATEPRSDFHGEGNLRIFDVGGLVEGGFAGDRGTALVGGRYSYTAAILSAVAPGVTLDYRDYQARFSYDVTPNDRLSVFAFGAYDFLSEDQGSVETTLFGSEFYRADLRYDRRWTTGTLRTAVTLGYDRTNAGFLSGEPRLVVDRSIGARTELEEQVSELVLLRAGADVTVDVNSVEASKYGDPEDPEARKFERVFAPRTDIATGVWMDAVLDVASNLELVPGLRADLYRSGSATSVGIDPRVAARFFVTPRFRLIHAYGLAHQPPSFVVPLSGLIPTPTDGELQRSIQTSAGAELDLGDATFASATLFYNAFFDMTDSLGTSSDDGAPDYESRTNGRAFGAELYLKRRLTRRVGGFLSYTLSRSERSVGHERFPSAFDRTHVVNAALAYDLGRGWRPGARAVFYTGTPTPAETRGAIPPLRTTDVERDPPFFRLDLRLEKRWTLGEHAWVSFVAEVMNTTFAKETFGGEESESPLIIPSIGAEVGF